MTFQFTGRSVYEISLFLAVKFRSAVQTTAVIAHLNTLYADRAKAASPTEAEDLLKRATASSIVCLLHYLVEGYPSHKTYFDHLKSLPNHCLNQDSDAYIWLTDVRGALSSGNYSKLESLTETAQMDQLVNLHRTDYHPQLVREAVDALVAALQNKIRERIWTVVRKAYRELSIIPDSVWLGKTLMMKSDEVQGWLRKREAEGHLKAKEGVEGRWVVLRVV